MTMKITTSDELNIKSPEGIMTYDINVQVWQYFYIKLNLVYD